MKIGGYVWKRCHKCGKTKYIPEANTGHADDGRVVHLCEPCWVDIFVPDRA